MNEEFDKWWANRQRNATPNYYTDSECVIAKRAYLAGAAAMREKCAEVTKELDIVPGSCNEYGELTSKYDNWLNGVFDAQEQVTAAIRKIEVG